MFKITDKHKREVLSDRDYIYKTNNPQGKFLKDDGSWDIPLASGQPSITASMDIPIYSLVTSDGFVADSNNLAHKDKIVGIAIQNIANGFSGNIQFSGELVNLGWSWSQGLVFLNGILVSSIAPTPDTSKYSKMIGIIKNSSTIIIDLNQSILF